MIYGEPLFNNVMCKIQMVSEKTKSGVIKGKTVETEESIDVSRLLVSAVGETVTSVKVGDYIAASPFVRNQFTPISIAGELHMIFPENCIVFKFYPNDSFVDTSKVIN